MGMILQYSFFRLYCNPLTYRKYFHWDHILILLWDPQVSSFVRGKHMPPEDIGSSFYPKHSSHSLRGPSVPEVSMKQIAGSEAGHSEIHYGRKSFCGLSEGLFYGFNWRLNIFSTGQLPTLSSTEMSIILLLKAVYSSIFQLCSMVWQINENRHSASCIYFHLQEKNWLCLLGIWLHSTISAKVKANGQSTSAIASEWS